MWLRVPYKNDWVKCLELRVGCTLPQATMEPQIEPKTTGVFWLLLSRFQIGLEHSKAWGDNFHRSLARGGLPGA